MKRSIVLTFIALAFLVGCAPDPIKNRTGTSEYYRLAIGLLDPDNPMPPIPASAVGNQSTQELCGIKTGMAMADVISAWGKPRALGINSAGRASLLFGHFCLLFDGERLTRITPNPSSKWKRQAGAVTTNIVQRSFAEIYYRSLNSLFRTNVSDYAFRLLNTNSVISVAKLKAGEIGGLKLGMTMSEAVAVRRNPFYFCRFSADRAVLFRVGSFRGDSLWAYSVDIPHDCQGIRFDNGLALTNSIAEYVKAFGPPLQSSESSVTYKFGKVYVRFGFLRDDNESGSEDIRTQVVLNGISLHFRGTGEICDEAHDRFVVSVSGITGIKRGKVESLTSGEGVDKFMSLLEKERGKPMTDKQRKKVAAALEKKESEIKKAWQDEDI